MDYKKIENWNERMKNQMDNGGASNGKGGAPEVIVAQSKASKVRDGNSDIPIF